MGHQFGYFREKKQNANQSTLKSWVTSLVILKKRNKMQIRAQSHQY